MKSRLSKVSKESSATRLIKSGFESLGLKKPLIGIAFVGSGNDKGIEKRLARSKKVLRHQGSVPAGCSFWELATDKLFYTVAEDHAHCSVGMYTHNLLRGEEDKEQLMKDISLMKKIDYVRMEEVATIPALKKNYRYTVYGPWADFKLPAVKRLGITPAVGFVFADAERGLILSEAVSRVDGSYPLTMGRPACAVIPQVVNSGKAAVSFGCCGARAYVLGLGKETTLWVFPGEKLEDYARAIATFTEANRILATGHKARKKSSLHGKELDLATAIKG